jgi:hypothetical protein
VYHAEGFAGPAPGARVFSGDIGPARPGEMCSDGLVHRHDVADVDVHSTDELASLLGAEVTGRRQLRAWPLSSVEQLDLADGSTWVYKAQRLLTVEPAFYLAAGSTPLLPACRVLTQDAESSTLLLEHLSRPWPLGGRSEASILRDAQMVVEAISSLPPGLPAFVEIDTSERWAMEVDWTLQGVSQLIADRRFSRVTTEDVEFLEGWSATAPVVAAVVETSRLASGDLKFDQVFEGTDGPRVVDWQVPVRGPADIDLVMLLVDRGMPPLRHVAPAVVGIRWFLHLRWAVYAKQSLIPAMPHLFDVWAAEAVAAVRAADAHRP